MKTELKFEELNATQKAEVMEHFIDLLQRKKIELPTKEDAEHHLYLFDEFGDVGAWRTAEMFSGGEPQKWSGAAFDLESGKAVAREVAVVAAEESPEQRRGLLGTWLERDDIMPSEANPREFYDPAKIEELRDGMRGCGFTPALSHLLVRPHPEHPYAYELVCGERRWRASGEMDAAFWDFQQRMSGRADIAHPVPVVVMPMSDNEAMELMLVENLQRDDLKAMEEAEGYRRMLGLLDRDGNAYTAESIAKKIGRSAAHVGQRIAIAKLRGTATGDAVESGVLPVSHARLLAKVPCEETRGELLAWVLDASLGEVPKSYKLLDERIATQVMVELRGAGFALDDATLVPVMLHLNAERSRGGACNGCPFNTKTEGDARGPAMCLHPGCFREKKTAAHARWQASVAAEGVTALGAEEAERLFDHTGKRLAYNSGFVELGEPPAEFECADDAPTPVPKWKTLVKGRGVPVVLVKDGNGEVHEIASRDVVVAAAAENGHDFLAKKKAAAVVPANAEPVPTSQTIEKPRETFEERDARFAKEARECERKARAEHGFLAAIFAGACAEKVHGIPFYELLCEPLTKLAPLMEESCFLEAARAMGYDSEAHGLDMQSVSTWLQCHVGALPREQAAAVALLIASGATLEDDREGWLKQAGKLFGVTRKDVEKQVAAEMKAEDAAEAQSWEIANGMTWSDSREKAEDFEWTGQSVAKNPTTCALAMPSGIKATCRVEVARNEKGWHVGWEFAASKKERVGEQCMAMEVSYSSRTLALRTGLLAIARHVGKEPEMKGRDAVSQRLGEYLAILDAPPNLSAKGAKKAKGGTSK